MVAPFVASISVVVVSGIVIILMLTCNQIVSMISDHTEYHIGPTCRSNRWPVINSSLGLMSLLLLLCHQFNKIE